MGRRGGAIEFQQVLGPTKFVKLLMIINAIVWFVGIVILDQYFLAGWVSDHFGLVPIKLIKDFQVWQPVSYLFIHTLNPLHIIFNMLLLWWMGSQLERIWGERYFALFYFVSGIGAAVLYCFASFVYAVATGKSEILLAPVIGASAALFGLLIAYGIYFGEQVVYFMFFFPMKAKWFVALLGGIEVVMVLNNGPVQGKVANLAHVFGLLSGYLFLKIGPMPGGKGRGHGGQKKKAKSSRLKLVVNNEEEFNDPDKPKYWN